MVCGNTSRMLRNYSPLRCKLSSSSRRRCLRRRKKKIRVVIAAVAVIVTPAALPTRTQTPRPVEAAATATRAAVEVVEAAVAVIVTQAAPAAAAAVVEVKCPLWYRSVPSLASEGVCLLETRKSTLPAKNLPSLLALTRRSVEEVDHHLILAREEIMIDEKDDDRTVAIDKTTIAMTDESIIDTIVVTMIVAVMNLDVYVIEVTQGDASPRLEREVEVIVARMTALIKNVADVEIEVTIPANDTEMISLIFNIISSEQVLRVCHGFEFEIVAGRVLEEERPLLARLSLEPLMRRNNEFHIMIT